MSHQSLAEERRFPPALRQVDVLARERQIAWPDLLDQATGGGNADDPAHSHRLQRPKIGAVVDLAGQKMVILPMPGKESHRAPGETADHDRRRGLAERGRELARFLDLKP